ncbi:hypothetical protein QO189_00890 [Psychrobacter sp. Arc29]|uniref:hypothetical protein n=1 Tax=Psychrobacter sp. Arc29 TaxID=3046690 RepID=UPI00352DE950
MQDDRFTWMHSGQLGAQQITGNSNGQMLKALDQALVLGFGDMTVESAVQTALNVTITYAEVHSYELQQLILISGADDSKLNGVHRIISKTDTTIVIDAAGVNNVTGTIKTKIAPLGFESIFGTTDPLKRAYRSANLQGTRTVLYLDMSLPTSHGYNSSNPAKRAMVDMCEDMTTLGVQINSYTDSYNNRPTVKNGQLFWYQARAYEKNHPVLDTKENSWVIVGNGDVFYFLQDWQRYNPDTLKNRDWYAFGDIPSFDPDDKFNCFWAGAINRNDTSPIYWAFNAAAAGGNPDNLETSSNPFAVGFFIKDAMGVGGLELVSLSVDGLEDHILYSGSTYNPMDVNSLNTDNLVGLPAYLGAKNKLRAIAPRLLLLPYNFNDSLEFDIQVTDEVLLVALSRDGFADNVWGYLAFDLGD